ncbi:hypothetical protein KI387_023219, partial [Taxus chinensis]
MVSQIFQARAKLPDVYDGGKTALHFAVMCQDLNDSYEMFKLILEHSPRKNDLVAKCDRKGRIALHEVTLHYAEKIGYRRDDYARGLAALFLNPYLKSPIAVGISGSWGMGKSSLMIQTEVILLQTLAQLSLLPSSNFSNSTSDIPGAKTMELSKKGQMKHREIKRQLDLLSDEQMQAKNPNEDSLDKFLDKYDVKYHGIFKSLAVMDKSDMFKQNGQPSNSKGDFPTEESLHAILTVQYNAWKYRNETEALAGMAVEITKEIKGTMTRAQWLSTCWRNTWNKKKYAIFTIALASSITFIVWVMLDRYKFKEWAKAKYACLPAALVFTGWTLTKSVMGIIKPVSSQLMNYMSFPDHTDKLGYQERVISDIKFLKEEMGKQPHGAFTTFLMLWKWTTSLFTTILMLWQWITLSILNPARSKRDTRIVEVATEIAKVAPALVTSLTRIIVFVGDLDRCNESVILQIVVSMKYINVSSRIATQAPTETDPAVSLVIPIGAEATQGNYSNR